ncbi:MAG: helix-turn-helix transcriptional regulator [Candidatus Marinimicrobia bacterium]|jgi:transcriptional regulator with XRE-family HTH domain|nr:helix-turn-helix transcriptional regulator [Candidatus Neomarinimicrobiota bacterium]|tara:strand:- start:190 stop:408 length:219 start_codon:yes stop_codon:yes gene_type:complete
MDIKQKIGERIKELRKHAGISQEKLAFKAGIDRTYINGVENGRRNISIKNIEKIAEALSITLSDFFDSPLFE